ncbi:MAG: Ig-like domain-containing protein [Thermoanaerobaculia bacterium]
MKETQRSVALSLALALAASTLSVPAVSAIAARESGDNTLALRSTLSEKLVTGRDSALLEDTRATLSPDIETAWQGFALDAGGQWVAYVDRRSGYVEYTEGSGIPWVPGRGNQLTKEDFQRDSGGAVRVDLTALDQKARALLPQVDSMLGVRGATLVLNQGRSGQPAAHVWFVDYDVQVGGLTVEGARVVFTINNGNLVSIGSENLPSPGTRVPERRVDRGTARELLGRYLGGWDLNDNFVDRGTYKLFPSALRDDRFPESFEPGKGRGVVGVWEFVFKREGVVGTWRARVDGATGEVLEFGDMNDYGSANGGTYQADRPATERVLPLPWANVATGVYTNSAGIFSGTTGTTTLNGQYVRISDTCGSISKAADGTGLLALGSGTGTDCTTPGSGGAGNTHASRTQFYNINRIKEKGRSWLPSNTWLTQQVTVNVNLNQTCNAYWDGSALNFFKSGGGCANTGELPGVSLHEFGHGLDTNDGSGDPPDNGSGETTGDFTAALITHQSCIGNGFLGSSNCGGYGDACTACSGVRDIDYAKHSSNTPATVANFTQTKCPAPSAQAPNYVGPCGRDAIARGQTSKKKEGHCESYVSSEALWDLAARDLPSPGSGSAWAIEDRLWYLSRSTSTGHFQCNVSGTTWTSDGCVTGSLFRVFRTIDDDNGNLADGTPHGGAIYAAMNRHGIACASDAGAQTTFAAVTPPAAPSLSVTAGDNSAALSWSGSSGVYDVYRNETGCSAGFVKAANDVASTSYTDNNVANGVTYYYQVVAQPSGNEAAASSPSTCLSVTPAASSNPDFSVAAAPGSVSIAQGGNGSSTITVGSTNSFNAAVALSVTGLPSGVSGSFAPASVTPPANGSATSTLTLSATASATLGTFSLTVTGTSGATTHSTSVSLTVTSAGALTAVYDSTLKAPKCASVGSSCDTGASLVLGRAALGPEPNQPNTINSTCADGTSGTYHSDESNDRVKVFTTDGSNFAPGKTVTVQATVWAYSSFSSDHLDLYYAADANSPTWTLIGTVNPTAAGAQVLSANYTLPSGGSLQAVRAAFRYTGSASSCSTGSYDDRDDLVFAVGAGVPDTTPPTTSITAPANGATVSGTTSVTASASDNVGVSSVEFYIDGALKGSDTSSPYSYSWNTTTYANGSHSIFSKAYDAAGNVGTSSTISVTVNNVAGCTAVSESETNDSRSTADPLVAPCSTVAGTFAGETGTSDYFSMSIPNGSTSTSLLNGLSVDYDLYVYNSAGTLLGSSTAGGTTSETVTWTNSTGAAATIYVRVYKYASTRTTYALKVSY